MPTADPHGEMEAAYAAGQERDRFHYDPPICGVRDFMGCNHPIEHWREMYRCTDCGVAFHKDCLLRHFEGAHTPHPLLTTQLMQTVAQMKVEIRELKYGDLSKPDRK